MSACQMYSLLRYLLVQEKTKMKRLLLLARFLDYLERDFKAVYPDMDSPMPDGYEKALRDIYFGEHMPDEEN